MKIDGLDPANKGPQPVKPADKEAVSVSSFGNLYDELISKTGATDPSRGLTAPLPGAGIPFIAPPVSGQNPYTDSMVVDRIENLFTDLEMFKNALSNSDIPIERLSSLISEFLERKDEMASMIGRIPDEELRGVVSDALTIVIDLVNQYQAGYAA
jgi:hypothetical protein